MTNELPVGWVKCKLEDFVQILDNCRKPINASEREKRLASAKTLYPYYGATGQVGYIDDYLTDGNYVLLGEDGAPFLDPIKQKAYKISGKTWVNNHAHILKGYCDISDEFICFWLNSVAYRPFVSGTTRLKLNQAKMKEIPCSLPPLAEQKRIVGKIEELFGEVDKAIEILKQKQAELKQYRQSVLFAAFSGKLYKTTEWPKIKLKSTMYLKNGYAFQSSSYKKEGIPLIRISDIDGQYVTLDFTAKITPSEAPEGFWVKKDDLLIAMSGATTGKLGVYTAEEPALQNQRVGNIKIKDENKVMKQYRNFLFMHLQKEILKNAYGGAQPNISSSKIEDMDFLLPTLPEQEQIVAEIEQRFEQADILEQSITDALDNAEKLKQSILKKAFEGKLVPQDPKDEPASVLLDRIKSEQKKGKKK